METVELHDPSSLCSILPSNIGGFLDIFDELFQFIQLHHCVAVVVETSSAFIRRFVEKCSECPHGS